MSEPKEPTNKAELHEYLTWLISPSDYEAGGIRLRLLKIKTSNVLEVMEEYLTSESAADAVKADELDREGFYHIQTQYWPHYVSAALNKQSS